uniref:Uncharacterized protein n=1 Tax=Arundo donax TaxID=35708 RepID=A0A0A9HPE2_ARUDO
MRGWIMLAPLEWCSLYLFFWYCVVLFFSFLFSSLFWEPSAPLWNSFYSCSPAGPRKKRVIYFALII